MTKYSISPLSGIFHFNQTGKAC